MTEKQDDWMGNSINGCDFEQTPGDSVKDLILNACSASPWFKESDVDQ